jgi:RHS repeat-associated protein
MSYNIRLYYTGFNYYLGGMGMPGRQYNATTGYRYGFNGKEKDNKDGVVQYDYGFRIYDPRLVRFKSTDPLICQSKWNGTQINGKTDAAQKLKDVMVCNCFVEKKHS